jgi:hypothetical protein
MTDNGRVVPSVVLQRIVVEFLTNDNVKPPEILKRLKAQFDDETSQGSRCMTGISYLKKAEQRLKTCGDHTFHGENNGQCFVGLSRGLIQRFSDRTTKL